MPTSAPASPAPAPANRPALGRRTLLAVALLAFVLQLVVLARSSGYQLADEVEYLDRAEMLLRGDWRRADEAVDMETIRSVVYPALLVPLLATVDALGLAEAWNVRLAGAFSMACGIALALVLARLAARHFGAAAGVVAGVVVASNPVLAQAATMPLSEALVALCLALGLAAVLDERGGWRAGLRAGLWFGFSAMIAYKSFAVALVALPALAVRDRWRGRGSWLALAAALAGMVLLQSLVDLAVYGRFGASVLTWLVVNLLTVLFRTCFELGLREAAVYLYDLLRVASGEVAEQERAARVASGELASRYPKGWYLTHAPGGFLAWPYLGLLLLGVLKELRRPRWTLLLLPGGIALTLYALSTKGEKSLRLLLPLLPLVALSCAAGWAWIAAALRARPALARAAAAALLLAGSWLSVDALLARNLKPYAGYWRAIEYVGRHAAERRAADPARPPATVAAAWMWAVQYRNSDDVRLVKLQLPLDAWPDLSKGDKELVERQLHGVDWFLVHLNALKHNPDLYAIANREFEVAELFYDPATYGVLEPIAALRRRTGDPGARTFFERRAGVDPRAFLAGVEHPFPVEFRAPGDGPARRLWFLGLDVEAGRADATQVWVTYHWLAGELGGEDYILLDRLCGPQQVYSFVANRSPAWGAAPTSTWAPGEIVSESYLREVPPDYLIFGTYWCLGDLVPTSVFLAVRKLREDGADLVPGLEPYLAHGDPLGTPGTPGDGRFAPPGPPRFSSLHAMYHAARVWLPVPPRSRALAEAFVAGRARD